MEETDVCYLTPTVLSLQQAIPNGCPAKTLAPSQRLTIGLQALAGTQTIAGLADDYDVSRKFVYQQAATAQAACQTAWLCSTGHRRRLRHRHPRRQRLALPGAPCRGDVFHAEYDATHVVTYLENRAYDAMAAHNKLEHN